MANQSTRHIAARILENIDKLPLTPAGQVMHEWDLSYPLAKLVARGYATATPEGREALLELAAYLEHKLARADA